MLVYQQSYPFPSTPSSPYSPIIALTNFALWRISHVLLPPTHFSYLFLFLLLCTIFLPMSICKATYFFLELTHILKTSKEIANDLYKEQISGYELKVKKI
jgi:hypothetical protein